jgi:hypothetical protein
MAKQYVADTELRVLMTPAERRMIAFVRQLFWLDWFMPSWHRARRTARRNDRYYW